MLIQSCAKQCIDQGFDDFRANNVKLPAMAYQISVSQISLFAFEINSI